MSLSQLAQELGNEDDDPPFPDKASCMIYQFFFFFYDIPYSRLTKFYVGHITGFEYIFRENMDKMKFELVL